MGTRACVPRDGQARQGVNPEAVPGECCSQSRAFLEGKNCKDRPVQSMGGRQAGMGGAPCCLIRKTRDTG